MTEPKWNMEKIHKEIQEARTKIFVVTKVLQTGSLNFSEYPEWALVVNPLLKDLIQNAKTIQSLLGDQFSKEES